MVHYGEVGLLFINRTILFGETLWNGKWKHPPAIGADIIKQHGAARFTSRGLHELNAAGPRAHALTGQLASRSALFCLPIGGSPLTAAAMATRSLTGSPLTLQRRALPSWLVTRGTRGERFPQNKSHHFVCVCVCVWGKKDITRLTPKRSRDKGAHRKADRNKIRQGQLWMWICSEAFVWGYSWA